VPLNMKTTNLSRRGALTALGMAAAAPAFGRSLRKPGKQPNIVYIMADDMGHADLGCYGSRNHKTPAIDRLSRRGIRFTQAYANSCVCSPTRTALLTGCYQGRFAIGLEEPVAFNGHELSLPRNIPTLPGELRKLGYRTSLVGKWHLGEPPASSPLDFGYDYFFGTHSGGTDYFAHATTLNGHRLGELYENREKISREGYLTDLIGTVAIDQIRAAHRDRVPFFISMHFTAPHWPWQTPDDAAGASAEKDARDMQNGNVRTYGRMIESMDANIGSVMRELARLGLDDDTIVMFTSDNGGERFSDSWPLTGMKGELLEGGIRVPLIASWPKGLPVGAVSAQVAMSMDAMPTLLAAAGGPIPQGMDGISLLPNLLDPARASARDLFWRHKARGQFAVRSGDWKYLRMEGKEFLFNLSADERERADLKSVEPDRLNALRSASESWNARMLGYPENSFSEDLKGKFADRI
jgi:arylsulfatase A-like enzyme